MKFGKKLLLFCFGISVIGLAVGACQTKYTFRGTVVDPPTAAPGFELIDAAGNPFKLDTLKGRVVLLYFGYTHCPDVCPLTLANLAHVRRELGSEASQVQVVFVTTDPDRDTGPVIQDYLAKFDGSFIGARGNWPEVAQVLQQYYASASKVVQAGTEPNYRVDHTAYVYAIDRRQAWRAIYSQDSKIDDMVSDVHYLLQE